MSEAGKKALGEGLDTLLAELKCSGKGGKTPKTPKEKKDRTKAEEDAKKLQRTIKAFLVSIHQVWFQDCLVYILCWVPFFNLGCVRKGQNAGRWLLT